MICVSIYGLNFENNLIELVLHIMKPKSREMYLLDSLYGTDFSDCRFIGPYRFFQNNIKSLKLVQDYGSSVFVPYILLHAFSFCFTAHFSLKLKLFKST